MDNEIILVRSEQGKNNGISAPEEWPAEIGKEFEDMDEDFKKWLLGRDDQGEAVKLLEFR